MQMKKQLNQEQAKADELPLSTVEVVPSSVPNQEMEN